MQVTLNTTQPYHLVYTHQAGCIVNMDLTNSILVGLEEGSLFPGDADTFVLGPLNSVAAVGNLNYWAIALSGTPEAAFMPGITNWSPSPAQVQEQIQALGLATEATQQIVKTNTATTASNVGAGNSLLSTGIALPVGAAKDTTVSGVTSVLNTGIALPVGAAKDTTVSGVTSVLNTGIALPVGAAKDTTVSGVTTAVGGLATSIPANIANQGAPLLALSTNVANPGAQTWTASQSRTYGPSNFGQISYEISLSLQSGPGESNPFFGLYFTWTDPVSGLIIDQDTWYLAAGPSGTPNLYNGTGHAKGGQLQVTLKWYGVNTSGSSQIVINQTSRVYVRDDLRSTSFAAWPGSTNASFDLNSGLVIGTSPTVAALSSATRAMPLYKGTVQANVFGTGSGGITFQVTNAAGQAINSYAANIVYTGTVAANGNGNFSFPLPRSNCLLTVSNSGATSQGIVAAIWISEQEV